MRPRGLEPRSPDEANKEINAYELTRGVLPTYVRDEFFLRLVEGRPIPSLPGEVGFHEGDWLPA